MLARRTTAGLIALAAGVVAVGTTGGPTAVPAAPWITAGGVALAALLVAAAEGRRGRRHARWLVPLAVALLALVAAQIHLRSGFPRTHDARLHLWSLYAIHRCALDGDLLPGWIPYLGLGYPLLQFYPPLTYLAGQPLMWLGATPVQAGGALMVLGAAGAGLGAAWAAGRLGASPAARVVAAGALMLAPYRLHDANYRFALAEVAAFALLPPFLVLGREVVRGIGGARARWAFLAVAAALLLTHLLSALMGGIVIGAWVAAEWALSGARGTRPAALGLLRLGGLCLASAGLVAWFVVPALAELPWTCITKFVPGSAHPLSGNGIALPDLIERYGWVEYAHTRVRLPADVDPNHAIPFYFGLGLLALAAAAVALTAGRRRLPPGASAAAVGGLVVALGLCLLFAAGIPAPLLDGLAPLRSLQFPWRFLGPAAVLAALGAAVAVRAAAPAGWWRAGLAGAVLALLALDAFPYLGAVDWHEPYRGATHQAWVGGDGWTYADLHEPFDAQLPRGEFVRVEDLRFPPADPRYRVARAYRAHLEYMSPAVFERYVEEGARVHDGRTSADHGVRHRYRSGDLEPRRLPARSLGQLRPRGGDRFRDLEGVEIRAGRVAVPLPAGSPAGRVRVLSQYFPGWQGRVDGGAWQPALDHKGLLALEVGEGSRRVEFRFTWNTPAKHLGVVLSLACWLGLALVAWSRRARRRGLPRLGAGLLALGLGGAGCGAVDDPHPPQAEQGELDLTAWDWQRDGPVPLHGEWALYWLDEGSAQGPPSAMAPVPDTWNGVEVDGVPVGSFGHGTYRLRVHLPPGSGEPLALKCLSVGTAYTARVDGRPVATAGTVGTSRATSDPEWLPQVVGLGPAGGEALELEIRVSNYHHRKGGLTEAIQLGPEDDLRLVRERRIAWQLFLVGCFAVFGLYHLALFALRRDDRALLSFGLFCLLLALYTALAGERFFAHVAPWSSWALRVRLTNLTSFLAVPVFLEFVGLLFRAESPRWVQRPLQGLLVALAAVVLVTPSWIYSYAIPWYHRVTLASLVFMVVIVGRALAARREGAVVFAVGFALLAAAVVNDILYDHAVVHTGQYIGVGLILFVFSQAFLLSVRHRKAYDTIEAQGLALARSNEALHREIEERELLERELQQAQKLEAIGTLAGGIAHDFNNLLMGIRGNVSLLVGQLAGHPEARRRLGYVERFVTDGVSLTRQLLGFARGGRYEIRALDPNALIERTSALFGETRKDVRIRRSLDPDVWAIEADLGQIDQVLLNLYVNAWQAMPSGGELRLATANVTLDEAAAEARTLPPGRYVRIRVEDTGVGMDEETQERIFEPFFTTKEPHHGSGLGLASAYGIVRSHGGSISVRSRPGEGSVFELHLPATDAVVAEEPAAPQPDQLVHGEGLILFVDDEEGILDLGVEMLRSLGYATLSARSGHEAIELVQRYRDRLDLVILDMIMPDLSGSETFDAIQAVAPGLRVLLCSGYSLDGEARDILARGCRGFIQKPYTVAALSQRIREVLRDEEPWP